MINYEIDKLWIFCANNKHKLLKNEQLYIMRRKKHSDNENNKLICRNVIFCSNNLYFSELFSKFSFFNDFLNLLQEFSFALSEFSFTLTFTFLAQTSCVGGTKGTLLACKIRMDSSRLKWYEVILESNLDAVICIVLI